MFGGDADGVAKEIVSTGRLPKDNTVVLMTTSNGQKMSDLSSYIAQKATRAFGF